MSCRHYFKIHFIFNGVYRGYVGTGAHRVQKGALAPTHSTMIFSKHLNDLVTNLGN